MFERMLNRKNESEKASMEKAQNKAQQALRDAEEAEKMLKSLEATAGKVLTEEEIEAGLEKARKGHEKKDIYPDRPSSTMDRAA